MFDANLILAEGNSGSYDWDYANLNSSGTPNSLSRNAGGFIVLDLGETPASGLTIVFIGKDGGITSDDALTLTVESSENADFSSVFHELAEFDLAAATSGEILGSEFPLIIMRRIATPDRYLRWKAVNISADAQGECWVMIDPFPFKVL